uniref:Uncharacterized protein n=1 Tax=Arundo donax TaxID=35708 RepID=A0A0A9SWS2_ARUDO
MDLYQHHEHTKGMHKNPPDMIFQRAKFYRF